MRRREFIQCMLPFAGMPLFFPMWSVANTLTGGSRLRKFMNIPEDGRVLVLVQLAGGNDGLNSVVPFENDAYYNLRPNLAIPRQEVIDLNGELGLHPSLQNFLRLYDEGQLAIVQGVGYPNPNRSHFKSTDIWLTASDSNDIQNTGWLGRYFDLVCPPDEGTDETCVTTGPPAIQIGLTSSLALLGKNPKGITLRDPLAFYNLVSRQNDGHGSDPTPTPQTVAERELLFLRETAAAAFEYADDIKTATEKGANTVTYPDTSLASQLAIVARLIAGGLSTRVYIVSIKGFDTHANQKGTHDALLLQVADAIYTFQQDLKNLGLSDRVIGMCFSEFGRRVRENASGGTDHGTAAPMFLFGKPIQGGLYGNHPSLTDLEYGDLKFQYDFRQLYATVLDQWLGFDSAQVLGKSYATLPLVNTVTGLNSDKQIPRDFFLSPAYPNPFNPATTIQYGLPSAGEVEISVFNTLGRRVAVLFRGYQSAGVHRLEWRPNGHSSGTYIVRMRTQGVQLIQKMQYVK